jgi:Fe-S-cluster-containing hydrogenase component 2
VNAISGERKKVHVIDQTACIKCGACLAACPAKVRAVAKYTGEKGRAIRGGAGAPKAA